MARRIRAERIAIEAGFVRGDARGGKALSEETFARVPNLPVVVWTRRQPGARCVHVYFEGDGHAWSSRSRPSFDPTPADPIGLQLAIRDSSGASIVYLGRPCQFLDPETRTGSDCRPIFWTNARYGDAVLRSLDATLDRVHQARPPVHLRLVGYSGGGVLAALLAAQRPDVDALATIAAPLDLEAWTTQAGVTPLVWSRQPMDEIEWLRRLPQDHFIGGDDSIVPASVALRFVRGLGEDAPARVHFLPEADHADWPTAWSALSASRWPECAVSEDEDR